MTEDQPPRKIPLIFYRLRPGNEPVREWLKGLPEAERHAIGKDLCVRNGGGQSGCPCAGHWERAYGRYGQTFRRNGPRVCCSAFTTSTSSPCTDS
jgi:hypothetical protein